MVPASAVNIRLGTARAPRPAAARAGALRRAAENFEALLIDRLMQDMQAVHFGPTGTDGAGGSVYRGLLNGQFSRRIASRDPFGIARLLEQQLGGKSPTGILAGRGAEPWAADPGPIPRGGYGENIPTRSAPSATARTVAAPAAASRLQARDFIHRILPEVKRAAAALNASPVALLAQAALETGWGRHQPRGAAGAASHNLFGVKAGADWRGPTADDSTREYAPGGFYSTRAEFRVYPDIRAGVMDFVNLVRPRLGAPGEQAPISPRGWGERLMRAGYATDPDYAAKLESIASGPLMRAALEGAREVFKSLPAVSLTDLLR